MKDGPVISNISLINKAFLELSSPLHYKLIVEYLRVNWAFGVGIIEQEAKTILDIALNAAYYYEEVEEQHYQRKQFHNSILDELYDNLTLSKVPIKQHSKNPQYKMTDLYRDPRFTIMVTDETYILLSRWNLLNDLAVRFFIKEHLENIPIYEATQLIKQHYQITDTNAFFFPHFDKRFTVKSNGKVSLKIHDDSQLDLFSTEVTNFIREEVARCTPKIISFLKDQYGEEVKIRSLIKVVFNIEVHYPKFPAYFISVREHLQTMPFTRLTPQGDSLIYLENEPVSISEKVFLHGVTDRELLNQQIQNVPSSVAVIEEILMEKAVANQRPSRTSLSYTVRYYDRIQETLAGHYFKDWLTSDELHIELIIDNEITSLIFFFDRNQNVLYGTHLENLMSDYAIIPGQKLHFQLEEDHLTLKIGNVSDASIKEQDRYLDIARLAEENKFIEKSLLQIVTETLIYHPSGLHFTEIVRLVKAEVPYAENSITATLSMHPFFEKVPEQRGFWVFNPAKWKKGIIENQIDSLKGQEKSKIKHVPKKVMTIAEYFKDTANRAQKNPS
jgi:RNA polymerase primary sigma factor